MNFGDRPFKHAAPDAEFVSVHEAKMRQLAAIFTNSGVLPAH